MSELQSPNLPVADPLASTFFTALKIDHARLLLPQEQISATGAASNMQPTTSAYQNAVGLIEQAGSDWPIYCLDSNFAFIANPPEQRQYCVLMSAAQKQFGILCDQIHTIAQSELTINPVPQCMRTEQLVLCGLGIYEDTVAYISSAEQLARLCHAHSN